MPQQASSVANLSDKELDALIQKKQGRDLSQVSDADLDKLIAQKSAPAKSGVDLNALKVGLETGGTFGARPFIAGLAGGAGAGFAQAMDGNFSNIMPAARSAFSEARADAQKEQQQVAQQSPKSFYSGDIVGSLLLPGGAVKGITGGAKGAIGAARLGAAYGGAQALGQADNVAEGVGMVGTGAVLGAGGEKLIQGGSAAARALSGKLNQGSANNAVKAAGAMLKDYRALEGKGKVQEVGHYLVDHGVVAAGDSLEGVAKKSADLKDSAGKTLESIYNYARNNSGGADIPGLNLVQHKEEILGAAKKALGDSEGAGSALNRLSNYIDERAAQYGDATLDPKKANDIKGAMDEVINYSRNPLNKEPNVEKAFHAARNVVSKKVDSGIDAIGAMTNSPELLAHLKEANKAYGYGTTATNMATDKTQRESANKALGLRQSILIGTGATAGAAVSPEDRIQGMIAGAAVGGSIKSLERYGPAALAQGERFLANKIQQSAVLRKMLEKNPAAYQNLLQQAVEGMGFSPSVPAPQPSPPPSIRLTR
jgi:hypothetical protein